MTLVLTEIRHLDADGTFAGHGREDVDAFGLERGGDVVGERGDFFQLHAGRGMQFVARDGRAFGDVAERDLDVELRERLLHEPRVGHEFLLGLGRLDGHVRVLEKIHRRQLVIADDRRLRDGDGLGLSRRAGFAHGAVGDVNVRLGLRLVGFFGTFRPAFSGSATGVSVLLQPAFRGSDFLPRISSVVAAANFARSRLLRLRAAVAEPASLAVRARWFCG